MTAETKTSHLPNASVGTAAMATRNLAAQAAGWGGTSTRRRVWATIFATPPPVGATATRRRIPTTAAAPAAPARIASIDPHPGGGRDGGGSDRARSLLPRRGTE